MTSPSTAPTLVERTEIHKSCKSVEMLLNILNEYCEAAGAVVVLQKKLSKALKDAANAKITGEIASNTMLASVNIFESLSDVNSKYSKIVDREYDTISNDVKRWFKKLTKEEKTHDERMANANAKIKQAGQLYERKSKKKNSDASEEHARYINLISTLGPEISQEKYDHAVNISQRHSNTIYNVAACLARLADVEWQKSCECVRRFSPTIGPLGNFRSLCEGGWSKPIPPDLPDITSPNDMPTRQMELKARLHPIEEDIRQSSVTPEPSNSAEQPRVAMRSYPSGTFTNKENSPDPVQDSQVGRDPQPVLTKWVPASTNVSTTFPDVALPSLSTDTLEPPKAPSVDPHTGSVRSLSAFPVPPRHFPIPPPHSPHRQQSTNSQSIQSSTSTSRLEFPSRSPLAESPTSAHEDLSVERAEVSTRNGHIDSAATHSVAESAPEQFNYKRPATLEAALTQGQPLLDVINDRESQGRSSHQPQPPSPQSVPWNSRQTSPLAHLSSNSVDIKPLKLYRDKESPTNKEYNSNSPTGNYKYSRLVERTDTGTSAGGSIVAAMRTRYDNNSGSTSPSPRHLPRLPINVNDMAARYQVEEVPLSPKLRTNSPTVSRQQSLPPLEIAPRRAQESHRTNLDEERHRLQLQDELAENSRWHKEQELMERELDLETRACELERDRVRLQALRQKAESNSRDIGYNHENNRGSDTQSGFGIRPRERRVSLRHQLQRPLSQMGLDESTESSESLFPPINQKMSTSRQLPQRSPRLPPPGDNSHMPPSTLQQIHTPKPSHPPSPLLKNEDSLHESHSSIRYRDDTSNSNTTDTTTSLNHAACCGCEKCSVSKYRSSESLNSQQPSGRKQKNSPVSRMGTGWIRRLSMPVGNAFNLDSKKHQNNNSISNYALGSGLAGRPSASRSGGIFSLDSKKNVSTTALGVREDGELIKSAAAHGRRSHEASGVGNRSMSNLGL